MARLGAPVNDGTTGASRIRLVTPDDDADLPLGVCAGLLVNGTGDISLIAEDDTDPVTITTVAAGYLLVRARRVRATDTTATPIYALYN